MSLEHKLATLPTRPGVYLMKNEAGEIIYVGKAKNLRNRVRSYFQSSRDHSPKVRVMVSHISDFEYIVTDSEVEALILENNLIKEHSPWYNVRLKDDKTYPYIKVTLYEDFPRVLLVRRRLNDGARYFGPYTDSKAVRETLAFLRAIFPIRTCRKEIRPGASDRPCLNYHLGRCLAPCAGLISVEDYRAMIGEAIAFLEGKVDHVLPSLTKKMQEAAEKLEFEKAARLRDQIRAIEKIAEQQKIVAAHSEDQDFLGYARIADLACVQVFFVREGKLVGREHFLLDCSPEEDEAEILKAFIEQFYAEAAFVPKSIFLPLEVGEQDVLESWLSELRGSRVRMHVPKRGTKKQLVDMVMENARTVLQVVRSRAERQEADINEALRQLEEVLELDGLPERIEAYDISHTQGSETVASMVVMLNGRLAGDEYRRFRIRSVQDEPNDYLSMQEVIRRRFTRGLKEQEEGEDGKFARFPDLVVIDGGKGQLNAAIAVRDELGLDIPFIGLAERLEEVFVEGQSDPVNLPRNTKGSLLLQRIRDEAHRFALTYHRNLRGKASRRSILDDVPGIGPKRKKALLRHFGTVKAIRQASVDELCQVEGINRKVAEEIYQYMHGAEGEA
ncbi:MAG: excinuclease ABC subunit UvrC [Firmicutes bacterium]|nr:excinuclease ABC subunit UvrC [Bacillota bacterium]